MEILDSRYIKNTPQEELQRRKDFFTLYKDCPIPDNEILYNLGLFTNRQTLSRILYMNELYKKIIEVHGVVMEFGVRWGQNLALFESFRGMYEPYNFNRTLVGFDTWEGFSSVDPKDGTSDIVATGSFSVTKGYEEYLNKVLDYHEHESPLSHIKKYRLVKGDASVTIDEYLNEHPETIVALAYFDFDIYAPTKKCLAAIRERLTKGSIVAFDELNWPGFPGETTALKEVFALNRYHIRRTPYNPHYAYIVID
ncbi:crotonobetainyl-CoA--carnitine CoA-transferase [Candidatus Uhrbacteria bacterium]|nr:crotonobetainyl-CoA--carnitine CoA-transferase [Candidatus Uhrbacteria bacterium]